MSNLKLLKPSLAQRKESQYFVEEFINNGENTINGCNGLNRIDSYEKWLNHLDINSKERISGRFTSETFFVQRMSDSKIVGVVDVRHSLNEDEYHYGHVGGSILPSERCKGYGTEMTKLGILKAIEFGNKKIVMSCYESNTASKRMIENNGMTIECKYVETDCQVTLVFSKVYQTV